MQVWIKKNLSSGFRILVLDALILYLFFLAKKILYLFIFSLEGCWALGPYPSQALSLLITSKSLSKRMGILWLLCDPLFMWEKGHYLCEKNEYTFIMFCDTHIKELSNSLVSSIIEIQTHSSELPSLIFMVVNLFFIFFFNFFRPLLWSKDTYPCVAKK